MGALSRCRLLSLATPASLFDVERFRSERRRVAVVCSVDAPTLVLGSTQPADVADAVGLRSHGVTATRRRSGGGAVYLSPGDQLWLDAWIPPEDPLWRRDVSVAAEWVGRWWLEALNRFGLGGLEVHSGRAVAGELGTLVCFAGRGPGEVFQGGRKVVGLSQWRAREGALFSSCAYLRWEPEKLVGLLDVDRARAPGMTAALEAVAVGLGETDPPVGDLDALAEALTASFATFGA